MSSNLRFTEEQIIAMLKEAETGVAVQDLCREYGISDSTFYEWRSKYGEQELSKSERLKQLEQENQHLKAAVVDLTLRNRALKRVVSKKW